MKEEPSKQPKIRVVDEESSAGEVVRLGGKEEVVRLGGDKPAPEKRVKPQRLEVGSGKEVEARTATVEEILDATDEVESPEIPLEDGWGGEAKKWMAVPWGWFVVIILICVGFAGWSVTHMLEHRGVTQLAVSRTIEMFETDREREEEARELYEAIEARIASYLASATIEERARHVRDAGRVLPLMHQWYEDHPVEAVQFVEVGTFQPMTIERRPFWLVRVETGSGARSLLLEQTNDDGALVDWETDVCFQPMPWDRFFAEQPEGEFDFRVEVRLDNFYAYEFADEKTYRCLRLGVRGSEEYLFGYVERGSAIDRRITRLLGRSMREVPMILRLRFLPGSKSRRSVVISEVVSVRWCMVGDEPG